MGRDARRVNAGGDGAVGAGGDVYAAVTGDQSSATYIQNQYVQQPPWPTPAESSPAETAQALRRYATRARECYGRLDLGLLRQ
ncbi:hypothetical protein ACFU53_18625 [Streptomyces sp. NPDC057474]|uniref:hypothetical protein n=1 Tax=Streptomyces sp. NPDC057474 TaxID=3346144 RepID=UPI0036B2F0DB